MGTSPMVREAGWALKFEKRMREWLAGGGGCATSLAPKLSESSHTSLKQSTKEFSPGKLRFCILYLRTDMHSQVIHHKYQVPGT